MQAVALQRSDCGTFFLHSDHLGSVSAATNASGALVGMQHYDPWGRVRTGGIGLTARNFTGQRLDATGLLYYHARYDDPTLGRFIAPDSLVPEPGDPQSLNRYAYVHNNPLKYTDPTGHWIESAVDIAFIADDIWDITQNGLTWDNGLALAADVGGLLLPGLTGGGMLVRAATHADDVAAGALHAAAHADDAADAVRTAAQGGEAAADAARTAAQGDEAAGAARRGDEGLRVLFGQARVDPTFSNKPDVPTHLKGRRLEEVAADLRAGVLQPKDIPIQAFEYQGQLVAANNRGLTTLSMAGMKPTNIIIRSPTRSELKRLSEISVLGDRLPSTRIAITPHRADHRILGVVHVPE